MLTVFAEGYFMAVAELATAAKAKPSDGQTQERDPRQADLFEDEPPNPVP
jgi:hypothetical protein